MSRRAASIKQIPVSDLTSGGPFGIALTSDGALWFTQMHTDQIGCSTARVS
jgi:streptogramin lyase